MDSWTYGVDNNKFPLLNSLKVNKRKIQKKKKKKKIITSMGFMEGGISVVVERAAG